MKFDQIIEKLWDKDEKARTLALDELKEFKRANEPLSVDFGTKALKAAARAYDFEEPERKDISRELTWIAVMNVKPLYISIVMDLFEKFDNEGRDAAQRILNGVGTLEAAQSFVKLIQTHAPAGKLSKLFVRSFADEPQHAKVFFPELFTYARDPKLSFDIYLLCLAHCRAKLITADELAPFLSQAVQTFQADVKKLGQFESRIDAYKKLEEESAAAREKKDFKRVSELLRKKYDMEAEDRLARDEAGLLLDLFRYFPSDKAEEPLREGLELNDPKLRFFALDSLMYLEKPVDQKHIEFVASKPETRNTLLKALQKTNTVTLVPKEFLTQKAFAETDMVEWLMFPTELGKAPDEIELMKIVPVDTGLKGGIYDYYVFRFRTKPPHWAAKDGWMAGVSGPFLRDSTSMQSLGETFSTFPKWGEKTPEELVGDIKELAEKWREHHRKENQ